MEKSIYDNTMEQIKKELDMLVSTNSLIPKYTKLFTLILRLRMLCDQRHFYKGLSPTQSPWVFLKPGVLPTSNIAMT